ncbi:hypothetical protein BD413DRAFT_106651 [Trametes elegans]|nr:hypothetical protein BD413DRAFT_106651 [Trametes elegans]
MRAHQPDLSALTPLFFTIHLVGGHVGLPALVATFLLSKTAKRHATVVNFCVVWILYSIIYCLLLYGGRATQEHPPHALCLAQAAMTYSAPPMAVVAGLAVVLQIWTTVAVPCKEARLASVPRWLQLVAILLPPYLVFIAFSVAAAYHGYKNSHLVHAKNGLYCGFMDGNFGRFAVPIFCGLFVALIIGFEVATIVRYFRGRRLIKKVFPLVDTQKPSLSPWCRVALFLLYAVLTLGVCVMDLAQGLRGLGYMIQAGLPFAAFMIFGLQKDVVMAWMTCGRHSRWTPEDPSLGAPRRTSRPESFMSSTTIDSTTPIVTYRPWGPMQSAASVV